jgi:hypothetical protein
MPLAAGISLTAAGERDPACHPQMSNGDLPHDRGGCRDVGAAQMHPMIVAIGYAVLLERHAG